MNKKLRDKIAAELFVQFVSNMKHDKIYNDVLVLANAEGKEVGTFLAEEAVRNADGFMEILEKSEPKSNRING